MNPVSEIETRKFTELLTHLISSTNQLPVNATNEQLQTCLKTVIGTFVLEGNIFSRILTAQATNIRELGGRLEQIQIALNQLLAWAKEQQSQ
jgi:hypothetical protein